MKKALLVVLSLCAFAAGQGKDTVAVYMAGEEPKGAHGSHKILGGELEKAISRSPKFVAVNRTDDILKALAQEQSYTRSGAVDDAQIKELGRQLGVQYLCVVEISEASRGYYLNAKMVDVVTAVTVKSGSDGSKLEDYNEMMAVAKRIALELTDIDLGTKPPPARTAQETNPAPHRIDADLNAGTVTAYNKSDWYFSAKYALPVNGIPIFNVNLWTGKVWKNGSFFGGDISLGTGGFRPDTTCIGDGCDEWKRNRYYDNETSRGSVLILVGGGLDFGGVYDLPYELRGKGLSLVYGASLGFWVITAIPNGGDLGGSGRNGSGSYEYSFGGFGRLGFLAPFIKLRWKSTEVSYRLFGGMSGSYFDDDEWGFHTHEFALGYYIEGKKRHGYGMK